MRVAVGVLLALHGLVHVAAFAKAFGLAELPALDYVPSRAAGVAWLAVGAAFVVAGALRVTGAGGWWIVGASALVVSQALIFGAFHAAKLGTVVNAILLLPVLLGALDARGSSLPSRYAFDVREALVHERTQRAGTRVAVVTDSDLARLPAPVATYLRRAGVVGMPRVLDLHAIFRARMRTARDAGWMNATVEQYELFGPEPRRLFLMKASRAGVPFVAFHRYVDGAATMQVRALGLFDVVDAHGAEMTKSETVTLLNDMCVLAPAALLDERVTWQAIGERQAKVTYSNAGHTVSAVLTFDAAGDLVGFDSDDRSQSDGKTSRRLPWSTPLSGYRDFGGVRLAAFGTASWKEPDGDVWTYAEFTLERIEYNVGAGE